MGLINKIFDKKAAPLLAAVFVILFIAERRRKLRKPSQPLIKRMVTNSIVAAPAFGLLRFVFLPAMVKLALKNKRYGVGYLLPFSPFLRLLTTFLILDYGNYLWHVLNHKIPLLWRFHLVHHTDLDLDTLTAFRFHFGEMIGSVFFRGLFVFLSGATAKEVLAYELLFESATQFHHSNMRIPRKLEACLNKIIVTPSMHGIHHSVNKDETDSNYAVIFSFWDSMHQTFKFNPDQKQIIIGVPEYRDASQMTVRYLLTMPFKKQYNYQSNMPCKLSIKPKRDIEAT
ncbi:sterol desaturase/sphingolipid hydroxylase (fatty acid hydroxylase superfamily) [Pedobacter sp. CG_S7]|uniref:sterol desaturase family protein n=1 Tax=Pedobacter sp. CG_S7 TaxID=3143930 RepID=UPI0033917646